MKFSVIVPIYNVEDYLRACVDSVLAQDFRDYEIILVDDGSPDNCGKICDEYAEKYPQIKTIHKENGGLSDARNFGIKEAKGEYLIFLDSDDYWEGTNVLSDLSDILEKDNHPDLILHGYTKINEIEERPYFSNLKIENKGFIADFGYLVSKGIYFSNAWTKIIKKDILVNNNLFFEKGLLHEDMPFSFDLASYIRTYSIYNSGFYRYRVRENSISTRLSKRNIEHLSNSILNKLNILLINRDIKDELKKGLEKFMANNMYYCVSNFLELPFRDLLSLYPLQKRIWDKSNSLWGRKYIRKVYFNRKNLGVFPLGLIILICFLLGKGGKNN